MAQHDYVIDNGGGAAVRGDINAALQAILTNNSGTTAPTVTKPFMLWFDTTAVALKIRNAADTAWVLYSDFVMADGSVTTAKLADGAVTAAKMPDGAVTSPKLASGAAAANIGYTPANDSSVVHLTGNESIGGVKTFTSPVNAATLKSTTTSPPAFQNSSGTEIGQLCRAWVNFNGVTTASIRSSFNVSSVTRNATGDYTVNFTNALADANYCAVSNGTRNLSGGVGGIVSGPGGSTGSTTSYRLRTCDSGGSVEDFIEVDFAVFR